MLHLPLVCTTVNGGIFGLPMSASDRLPKLLLRFAMSGGLATVMHWSLMALLMRAHWPAEVATALGALVGAIVNYVMQRYFTFRVNVAHMRALPRYVLVMMLGWIANLTLFAVLHSGMMLATGLAQVFTSALVALLSFTLYRSLVFHDRIHSSMAG